MGSFLMYELMAEERSTRYRAEAEHDRQVAEFGALRGHSAAPRRNEPAAARRPAATNALGPQAGDGSTRRGGTRRALAAALVGLAAIRALRGRRAIGR